ncbi:MAG: hypothetical protein IJX60_05390 [Paludibacteraceae bacterium]|nr:hypothetical protein [Paludibacteraceae bacterium]
MQIRVFTIPALAGQEMQEEMNKFLRGHRVMEVKQQYDTERGYWTFAVNYSPQQSRCVHSWGIVCHELANVYRLVVLLVMNRKCVIYIGNITKICSHRKI